HEAWLGYKGFFQCSGKIRRGWDLSVRSRSVVGRFRANQRVGHVKVLQGNSRTIEDRDFIVEAASGGPLFNDVADWHYRKHAGVDVFAHVLELADLDGLGKQVTKEACPGK